MKRSIIVVDEQVKSLLENIGNLAAKGAIVEVQGMMNKISQLIKEEDFAEPEKIK